MFTESCELSSNVSSFLRCVTEMNLFTHAILLFISDIIFIGRLNTALSTSLESTRCIWWSIFLLSLHCQIYVEQVLLLLLTLYVLNVFKEKKSYYTHHILEKSWQVVGNSLWWQSIMWCIIYSHAYINVKLCPSAPSKRPMFNWCSVFSFKNLFPNTSHWKLTTAQADLRLVSYALFVVTMRKKFGNELSWLDSVLN